MSAGEIAGLIAAGAFVVLVVILAVPLLRLAAVLSETRQLVADLDRQTVPLLGEVRTSVTQVNAELVRVDAITANVQSISGNLSALTSLFVATMGSPIIKVAAFSYGVRRAVGEKERGEVEKRVNAELHAERVARKAARRGGAGRATDAIGSAAGAVDIATAGSGGPAGSSSAAGASSPTGSSGSVRA